VNFPVFQVGSSGTGTVNVESGGKLSSAFTLERGADTAAVGHVNVSGSGSQVSVGGTTVGVTGNGTSDITITGPGATFSGGLMNIGGGAKGLFDALAGASASASQFTAGTNSTGAATFTGKDTTLTVTNGVRVGVGSGGIGTLDIEDQAVVSSATGQIGTGTGATGTATLTGAGSQWKMTSSLTIGQSANSGTGTLNVLEGGRVDALSFTGFNSATVKVDGAGSQFNLTGSGTTFTLGGTGASNKLDLTGGAAMTSGGAVLTTIAGSGVAVNVAGEGTSWNAAGIKMGGAGASTMIIDDKASVGVVGDFIVDGAASTVLTISNGASVTEDPGVPGTGQFRLGVDGQGTLKIESGGTLETLGHPTFATFTFLARNAGSKATATVTGAGSTWATHNIFVVGQGGDATLDILDGATVTGERSATVAATKTSTATVTVSGAGSSWLLAEPPPLAGVSTIRVGQDGNGTLIVQDGGRVAAQGLGVGSLAGTGTATVTGVGSKIDLDVADFQTFDVAGSGAKGTVNILDGGQVNLAGTGTIGFSIIFSGVQDLGEGTVTVDGTNSRLTMTGTFDVGAHATGTLNVQNGGFVSNSDGYLGSFTNINGGAGSGTATVTGAGSKWENLGFLRVGDQGTGVLKILSGGEVTSTDGVLANEANTTGNVTIDGVGSSWKLSGGLKIGNLGTGTLDVTGGGLLSAALASSINSLSTLNVGTGGLAGTFSAPSLANAGKIHFDHTDTTAFNAAISGTGTVVKDGIGTAIFTGANTYTGLTTINGGVLQIGNGGATGSIIGDVVNDALLAVNRTGSFVYGGAISGSGGLRQVGTGTTTLTGTNTYLGTTSIDAGTLLVNGSIVGPVTVNDGGTLGGTGSVGTTSVLSGGTFAPGASIGTTKVNGDVSFASGSTFAVEINAAGQNDKVEATGTGTLSGGLVQVLADTGSYALETKYTILTAGKGVSGLFDSATSNLAFLTPTVTYDPSNVYLTMLRNSTEFAAVARTRNQRSVAGALDDSPFDSTLVQAVLNLSEGGARQAFDVLSGEIHASVHSALVDDSRYIRDAVLGRLRAVSDTRVAGASPVSRSLLADASGLALVPPQARNWTAWAQATGAFASFDGDGNAASAGRDLGGFFAGVDGRFGDGWWLGAATGYSHSSLNVDDRRSKVGVDSTYLGIYGGRSFGPWTARAGFTYALHAVDATRSVAFPGFSETATSRYDGGTAQLFAETGYSASFRNVALEPFAGLAWVGARTDDLAENGGAAALDGSGGSLSVGYWTLGVRAASRYVLADGTTLLPRASLAWQHTLGGTTPDAQLAFQSTGVAFGVAGVPLARDSALFDAGVDMPLGPRATVGISYGAQLGNSLADHAIKAKFAWQF
jgi:outer membrane autotransporter protein